MEPFTSDRKRAQASEALSRGNATRIDAPVSSSRSAMQRLRFNQLIDSVGSVSLSNVNQTAGRSTFAGSYPTVGEALKEHEARLGTKKCHSEITHMKSM